MIISADPGSPNNLGADRRGADLQSLVADRPRSDTHCKGQPRKSGKTKKSFCMRDRVDAMERKSQRGAWSAEVRGRR